MEIVNLLSEAINSLGFPIAMVAYFIWDKNNTTKSMLESIDNNTRVLTLLLDKLDSIQLMTKNEE